MALFSFWFESCFVRAIGLFQSRSWPGPDIPGRNTSLIFTPRILPGSNQILPICHSIIVQFLKLIDITIITFAVIIIINASTTWRRWSFVLVSSVKITGTAGFPAIFFQHFYSFNIRMIQSPISRKYGNLWSTNLFDASDPMWASAMQHKTLN